jgi:uncharacterized SAM-binding protein YcdF (DUF218 family)
MLRIGLKLLLVTLIFIISCLIYNGLSFKPITSVQKTSTHTQNKHIVHRFENDDVVVTVEQKNSEFVVGVGYRF